MARAITQRDREARRHSLETQSRYFNLKRCGILDGTTCAGAVTNRKSARVKISTEAPPPGGGACMETRLVKMTYNLNDILDDVIAHH